MNKCEVRLFLGRFKAVKNEILHLNDVLRELEADKTSLKAVNYSNNKITCSGENDTLSVILDRIKRIEKKRQEKIEEKYRVEDEIVSFIEKISNADRDCDILYDKHIALLSYKQLQRKYKYDYDTLKTKVSRAYGKLAIKTKENA